MAVEQKGLKDIVGSGDNLAVVAAILAVVALALPFIGMKTNLGMGLDQSGSMNGFTAAGWSAWVVLLAFIGAALSRRVPAISAYRNLIDFAALIMVVVALAWAWFMNPLTAQLKQMKDGLGTALGGAMQGVEVPDMASLYPHVGMGVLLVSGVVLVLARLKG